MAIEEVRTYCEKCRVYMKPTFFMRLGATGFDVTGHIQCSCGSYYEYTYEGGKLVYFEKVTANRLLNPARAGRRDEPNEDEKEGNNEQKDRADNHGKDRQHP